MNSSIYTGSHRDLFQAFLELVDDSDNQLTAILDAVSWKDVASMLSIGGGQGLIEAALLKHAPRSSIWYVDPSADQCDAFKHHMQEMELIDRVKEISPTSFQDYVTAQAFDRILAVFSWFYIGTDEQWLGKLLGLLAPGGTAILLIPGAGSIETIFYRTFSTDIRMALIGDEVVDALSSLHADVSQNTYTKWLKEDELFEDEDLSDGSLALAAFAAERPSTTFTPDEKKDVAKLLKGSQQEQGVPLSWDLIAITNRSDD